MTLQRNHDKLAYRLTQILVKLNRGMDLDTAKLAEEFGVDRRTIQRDLNQRFDFLCLENKDGVYRAIPGSLGRLTEGELERFACMAGVRDLFPDLGSDTLLARLRDPQATVLVHDHHLEDIEERSELFGQLEFAVLQKCRASFRYLKGDGYKVYDPVEPYKLVNHQGMWYLAAAHEGKLKSFVVSKIDGLLLQGDTRFAPNLAFENQLANEDSIWLNPNKVTVQLRVAKAAAGYFLRRQLLPAQELVQQLDDGSLILTCKVAHEDQILPTVRYWLPHIQIISPDAYRENLKRLLQGYMEAL